jgi:hypothetical protein
MVLTHNILLFKKNKTFILLHINTLCVKIPSKHMLNHFWIFFCHNMCFRVFLCVAPHRPEFWRFHCEKM